LGNTGVYLLGVRVMWVVEWMMAIFWFPFAVGASVAPPQLVYNFDLSYTNGLSSVDRFEHVHTVAALAGIVNRDAPRLFTPLLVSGGAVDGGATADDQWREYLTSKGEWLEQTTWVNVSSLHDLVRIFADDLSAGVVLYDPTVPATSNLASTAAGTERLLPVSYRPKVTGSVYHQLMETDSPLNIGLNLTGTFSSKVDAYQWARKRWLSPRSAFPQANPAKLGYYVDYWAALQGDRLHASPGLTEVSNHDYFISQRAFFFDLSVWADEKPVDDKGQPLGADKEELLEIFKAAYQATQQPGYNGPEMIHVGGFTPWWFKYTKDGPGGVNVSKHGGVETEWETMNVIGPYNAFDDGDACCVGAMANSAFYQHYPLDPNGLVQNAKPTISDLHHRGLIDPTNGKVALGQYAAFYGGDYDGAAWLYNQLKTKWDDPKRGQIPIGWAVDSELSMRFPVIYKYLYASKTKNDWFISGDSGAGYLNPTLLFPNESTGRRGESNVTKSGAPAWTDWNTKWYSKFDLSFTGFIINGDAGLLTRESLQIYTAFSPDGVVISTDHDPHQEQTGDMYEKENGGAWVNAGGTPVLHHVLDLPKNVTQGSQAIVNTIRSDERKKDMAGKPRFYVFRTILMSASLMVDIGTEAMKKMGKSLRFVDPYTLGLLVKCDAGAMDCKEKR
jgi:hypothetical protein